MNYYNFNNLVNKCVELVDKARGNYYDSDEMRSMLYVSFIAFSLFYGDKVINRIYELFKNVSIYCEDDSLVNIIEKYSSHNIQINEGENAISVYGGDCNECFISKASLYNEVELMDRLLHELNHIFVGAKYKILGNHLFIYAGLSFTLKVGGRVREQNGVEFNEAINSLVSEEMVNLLIGLSKFRIDNKMVRDYLRKFRKCRHYYTFSYTGLVDTLRDFYNVSEIKLKIKYAFIHNDYKILESYINYILYDDNGYEKIIHSMKESKFGKVRKLVSNI